MLQLNTRRMYQYYKHWTCTNCLHTTLPFSNVDLELDYSGISINESLTTNNHLEVINANKNLLKIFHINTQSLSSTFDEFLLTIKEYDFDIVAMSETWLKNNKLLLDYVHIPGYDLFYNNRDVIKGGGVGCYIKSSIKTKRRNDIEKSDTELEHLWFEVSGRNKHVKLLVGVIYRSQKFQTYNEWLDHFEELLNKIKSTWDGPILITGDLNINLIDHLHTDVQKYTNILSQFNLDQVVTKPTRVTKNSSTLIDHIIISNKELIKHTDVLPCPLISDHDGPYALINVRTPRYESRFKMIRDETHFDEVKYQYDVSTLPFSTIYAIEDSDEKLEISNELISTTIDKHAPTKKIRVTRQPNLQ